MKKDMNKLVESFFARKENVISSSVLEELVKQQFKRLNEEATKDYSKVAQPPKKGYGGGKKELVVKYSFIPEISVSELGWSSLQQTESGDIVPSAQRKQLFDYLKNIKGSDLAEKIRSINEFYKKTPEQLEREGFFKTDSKSEKIQQIISYLVFLKTLTTIITNFNAASAGFAFESFLGVLLEGTQVPTNSGTIADLTTGGSMGKIGISLKLYSEASVHVGGSFTDLANDMINPKNPENPFIRYILATKSLSGKGLETTGRIAIYQFDIDINNIFNVLALTSKESRECIRLPKLYISSKGSTDFSYLKKVSKTPEEIKSFFEEKMKQAFSDEDPDKFSQFYDVLVKAHEDPNFWTKDAKKAGSLGRATPVTRGKSGSSEPIINKLIKQAIQTGLLKNPDGKFYLSSLSAIYKATEQFGRGESTKTSNPEIQAEGKARAPKAEEEKELAPGVALASVEESIKFYNSLDEAGKKKALVNAQGYLTTEQFGMTMNQVTAVMSGTNQKETGEIAAIEVGVKNVETILNQLASSINQQVFEIFDSLNVLTSNINSYFATGLKDDNAADTAQAAAGNIDKKTEEIQTQTKGR